jgi:hypothetical protein
LIQGIVLKKIPELLLVTGVIARTWDVVPCVPEVLLQDVCEARVAKCAAFFVRTITEVFFSLNDGLIHFLPEFLPPKESGIPGWARGPAAGRPQPP